MKPIPTPFTGKQLSKLLDTMTPEQLDMPLLVYLTQSFNGQCRVLSVFSADMHKGVHTDGIISNTLQINQYDNEGRN